MQVATWISVVILGIGAPAIFVWFLADMVRLSGKQGERTPSEDTNK